MTFLNLISGIIGLAKSLAGLFRDRRLVKSGEARQALFQSQETLKIIKASEFLGSNSKAILSFS